MPSYIVDDRGKLILKKEIFSLQVLGHLEALSKLNKILSDFTKLKILYLFTVCEHLGRKPEDEAGRERHPLSRRDTPPVRAGRMSLSSGEINVSKIVEELKASQSLISHQLALLRRSKLVTSRRMSKIVYYSLSPLGKSVLEKYI